MASKKVLPIALTIVPFVALGTAGACSTPENCVDTQTCEPASQAGMGGENPGTGGSSPQTGGTGGRGGSGGAQGGNGGTTGDGGTSPSGGTGASDAGASGEGGEGGGMGGEAGDTGMGGTAGSGGAAGNGGMAGNGGAGNGGAAGKGGAGSGGTAGKGGAGSGGAGGDTTAPTIVSVSPVNNASGVQELANIVVTFSEPMDQPTTDAAYVSADVGPANLTWNGNSTVLTINPNNDLLYAEGTSTATVARAYGVTITTSARDAAGNRLAQDFTWQFRTIRRIRPSIAASTVNPTCSSDSAQISCYGGSPASSCDQIDVVFSMSGIPSNWLAVEAANVSFNLTSNTGYSSVCLSAPMHLMDFSGTMATDDLGVIPNNCVAGARTMDVMNAFFVDLQDRAARQEQSGYSIQPRSYDTVPGNNSFTHFRCSDFKLNVVYLVE